MSGLDVTRLRVLRAVVANGTVQAAADRLGYTPSAVSQQLATLQKETGLVLFERSGRGIAPTAAGRLLADRSDDVMASLSRLDGLVGDLRDGRTGTVTIGTPASVAEQWIPPVAEALARDFPEVMLSVDMNELPAAPRQGYDIDVRGEDSADEAVLVPGYRRVVLGDDPYLLAVGTGHPLATRADPIVAADLAEERWIDDDPYDTVCGRIRARSWQSAGVRPRYVARAADHHAALAFVGAGVGIALLPRLALGNLPASVRVLPVADLRPVRRLAMHVNEAGAADPAVIRVQDALRAAARAAER